MSPETPILSVRFTTAMDRASTAKAFKVAAGGKAVAGKVTWAEGDRVLIFKPAALLPYFKPVSMTVASDRQDRRWDADRGGGARPVPDRREAGRARDRTRGQRRRWRVERAAVAAAAAARSVAAAGVRSRCYYLGLMNCTRTGGWVTSTGACSSPGGRSVAPLSLSSGISTNVSRPYAKKLATTNQCTHFSGGNPGDRLRAAGYSSYRWAENLGCRSGAPRSAVLGSHLFFQSEKSYNGGHYVNMMNAMYDRVGIGVWVSGGRVRLVIDFYHP